MKNFFIFLTFIAVIQSSLAQDLWVTVKKDEVDLNNDGKKDLIHWVTKSKEAEATPEKVIVSIDQKSILEFQGELCSPGLEYRNPDGCYALKFESKLSSKKQPLLTLRSEETASNVDQSSSTYIYRWMNNQFELIGATYEHHNTGQVKEREYEVYDINYSTGNAIHTTWVEVGEKETGKKSEKCTLKKPRKGEPLSSFTGLLIMDEVSCKK